jgi:hypothetical protein
MRAARSGAWHDSTVQNRLEPLADGGASLAKMLFIDREPFKVLLLKYFR